MSKVMVFLQESGVVSVVTPAPNTGLTLEQIGAQATPHGVKFWIIDAASVPTDKTFRTAWELDEASLGEPSGYGEE